MREKRSYFPVNWIDGMKINKTHFIEQDNAWADALHEATTLCLSPIRYGVLPPSADRENTFDIPISLDNTGVISVRVNFCQAITSGGVRISLPGASDKATEAGSDKGLTKNFSYNKEPILWIFLLVHPFIKQAAGSQDTSENPPRYRNVLPTYSLEMVNENEFRNYDRHPYAMAVGKIINGQVDSEYIPPCISLESYPALITLHGLVRSFLIDLESSCSVTIQNVMKKEKPNEVSLLVRFLCEKMLLCLAQLITDINWNISYEPPAMLFADISTLARVMINEIGIRTGSGKEELLNYLSKWSPVKLEQGELEAKLNKIKDSGSFSNNDINRSRQQLLEFISIISPLFETLSKQQFPGEDRRSGVFVDTDNRLR